MTTTKLKYIADKRKVSLINNTPRRGISGQTLIVSGPLPGCILHLLRKYHFIHNQSWKIVGMRRSKHPKPLSASWTVSSTRTRHPQHHTGSLGQRYNIRYHQHTDPNCCITSPSTFMQMLKGGEICETCRTPSILIGTCDGMCACRSNGEEFWQHGTFPERGPDEDTVPSQPGGRWRGRRSGQPDPGISQDIQYLIDQQLRFGLTRFCQNK